MNTITVVAKKDCLERLAKAAPMKALSELIWNGLDAGSDRVEVELKQNALSGLDQIKIKDYGTGIDHGHVADLFGNLGASWKKSKRRHKGRALHGKNGEGRFKAFALGNRVEWNTTFQNASGSFTYQIIGRIESPEKPMFSDPVAVNGDAPGTEVLITGIERSHGALLSDSATEELAKHFAPYLSKCPTVEIIFNGVRIDPATLQDHSKNLYLESVDLGNGKKAKVEITVIEWKTPTKRILHLCDADGVSLHEAEAGSQIRARGFPRKGTELVLRTNTTLPTVAVRRHDVPSGSHSSPLGVHGRQFGGHGYSFGEMVRVVCTSGHGAQPPTA